MSNDSVSNDSVSNDSVSNDSVHNDTEEADVLVGAAVLGRLAESGFEIVERSADGAHVLVRRDVHEFAVPGPDRMVPIGVARMLESALAPLLGADWLLGVGVDGGVDRGDPVDTDAGGVLVLDAAVLPPDGDSPWRAFLLDDLATVGFGEDRTAALRDLKAATALRLHTRPEALALVTPDVI